ncbi:MAG: hypothetical protein ACI9KE_004268 [Polyangiales bacterium]|jgi:hypothetical protein
MFLRQRRTLAYASALFGALVMSLSSASASAQSQRSPSEAAAEVRERGGYGDEVQHIRPGGGGPVPFPSGSGSGATDEDRRNGRRGDSDIQRYLRGQDFDNVDASEESSGLDLSLPSAFGQGLGYLMMLIAGLGLLALIVVLVMTFWPKGDRLDPVPQKTKAAAHAALIEALPWNPGDPNELARSGRYAEAIVALLVQALKAAGWREEERARTAREVLRALAAEDSRRDPLAHVVGRAEHVRFAGAEATLELYEEVRVLVDQVLRAPVISAQLAPPPSHADAP